MPDRAAAVRRMRSIRPGYMLIYVVIGVAAIAVIAAAVAPIIAQNEDAKRVSATYATLSKIDSGIVRFGTLVKRVGTVYPGAIHQLDTLVTTSDTVSCGGNTMNATSISTWTTNGPFIGFYAPKTGLYTPLGRINDGIEHSGTNQPMYVRIPLVDATLVTMLDGLVDNSDGGAAGTILFGTPNASGQVDVRYRVGFAPSFTLINQC